MLASIKGNSFTSSSQFRSTFTGIALVSNAFIWYLYSSRLLAEISFSGFSDYQAILVWGMNIIGAAFATIFGFFLSKKFSRTKFLSYWMLVGIPLSLVPLVADITAFYDALFFFTFVGVYFGLGMPVSLAYFASVTKETNRSRLGGITFFVSFVGVFLLGAIGITNVALNAAVLAGCRAGGLITVLMIKPAENVILKKDDTSYFSVLRNKAFILYFVPWIMFTIVNYIASPVVGQIFPGLFKSSMLIEDVLAGIFAVISGFFADRIGRKSLVLTGFVLLGLGYASLGLFTENIASWWFYTIADGISWGVFYTIFLMTIWGDIAMGARSSEKYYAIGYLPFLFSIYAQMTFGMTISTVIHATAIFSFTSVFLFVAILPLTYAPETLSLHILKNRELQKYAKKAQGLKLSVESNKTSKKYDPDLA